MKKIHILLIVLFGVFLIPNVAFACGNKSEKKSCSKEMSSEMGMKDCCSKDSKSESDNQQGCDGKCGHSVCSVTSVFMGIVAITPAENQDNVFNFSTQKQKFYHSETVTSDGYSSIWLIPKIS